MTTPEVLDTHPPAASMSGLMTLTGALSDLAQARAVLLDDTGRPRAGSDHDRLRALAAQLADKAAQLRDALGGPR